MCPELVAPYPELFIQGINLLNILPLGHTYQQVGHKIFFIDSPSSEGA